MTPQELKNSILQLAIQGKLVEQRPEEGTAEELFARIQEEKQQLIKEKKIKKEKPLPEITDDEKPFNIPESWMWVRWGDLSESIQYGYNAPAQSVGRIKMVRISDIQEGKVIWESVPFCNIQEDEISNYLLKKNDILFARTGGTVGKSYLVKDIPDEAIYAGYLIRTRYSESLCPEYMKCFMESLLYWTQLKNGTIATAQPNCNGKTLSKMVLPLPPLAEQKRIVAKIEELLPYIERYEQAWSKLEKFNSRFPEDMKKSLLQYAIQGKLVEQRSEEGTAKELFEQIQEEKQRLIKEKKIKKEKSLPEITDDEKPFDIPESWKWVRIQDISWFIDAGKSPKCNKQPVCDKEWGVITTTAIQKGFFDEKQNKVLPQDFVINPLMQVHIGDILITRAGPTNRTGVACLVKKIKYNLILSDKTLRINMTNDFVYKNYIVMAINSPPIRSLIIDLMSGMDKQQVNISQNKYKTLLIPLPPLAEQRRIVEKLERLLPLCEQLK